MFRRNSDGIAVPASIRMNDGAILIGTINCGASGRLEALLSGDSSFIEFVSKDGQQCFIARHQVASIEPLATIREPDLPALFDETDPFQVLGVQPGGTLERAMAAFHTLLQLYSPERWSGENIPFEFNRYAAEKTRQLNMAFTAVRADIQAREEQRRDMVRPKPYFGIAKAVS